MPTPRKSEKKAILGCLLDFGLKGFSFLAVVVYAITFEPARFDCSCILGDLLRPDVSRFIISGAL